MFPNASVYAQALADFDWNWQDRSPRRRAAGERRFNILVAASRTSPAHQRMWDMFVANLDRERRFAAEARPPRVG